MASGVTNVTIHVLPTVLHVLKEVEMEEGRVRLVYPGSMVRFIVANPVRLDVTVVHVI